MKYLPERQSSVMVDGEWYVCAGCFEPIDIAFANARCFECGFLFHWTITCRGEQYKTSGSPSRIPCKNCCDES